MKKGPHPVLYDRTNTERLSALDFGILRPGVSSQEIVVWLWNKKDFSDAPAATDVRITVVAANKWADEVIENRNIKVKSSGIMDPDGAGIVDDAEDEFTPIGGELTDPDSYHSVGDIPSNCARRLFFRIDTPADMDVEGQPRAIMQVGFMSAEVKWLYASE